MVADELPTEVQLGVSNARLIWRGLALKCPACGHRGLIVRWFGIRDRCPTCDLQVDRIEGHYIGAIGLNVLVCFTLTFLIVLAGTLAMVPNVDPLTLLVLALLPGVLGPVLFAPGSRTTWTAIDLAMRPLKPGEIDPRFVKVDPGRDAGTQEH